MCTSSPKVNTPVQTTTAPKTETTKTEPEKKEEIQAQTQADASVTKSVLGARNKATGLAGRDSKTGSRGLNSDAVVSRKKELLGG